MFNRSMRRLARRLNMSLSQHGLFHGVMRKVWNMQLIFYLEIYSTLGRGKNQYGTGIEYTNRRVYLSIS